MKRRKQISNRRSHSHRRLKNLSRKKSKLRSKKKRTAGNIIFGLGSQGYTNAPSTTRKDLRNYMKFNKGRAAFKKKTQDHIEHLKKTLFKLYDVLNSRIIFFVQNECRGDQGDRK